jgi:hypothetical protein
VPNPVVHFEIAGKDGKKLQDFYRELFEWPVEVDEKMDYGMVPRVEPGIGGGIYTSEQGSQVTFYVAVDDLQASLDRAESLGGKTIVPPTEIPDVVTFAQFADPEGNVIGLVRSSQQ